VEDVEDFTYFVGYDSVPRFHFREVTPKDFYFAQILRASERTMFELAERLLLNPEVLDEVSASKTRGVLNWVGETLLTEKILTVENWLEIAYHLCKQRWDSSVDWLETQPMSKIQAMIQVVDRHVSNQEKAMKKSGRKR